MNKDMTKSKQLAVNLSANFIAYAVNLGISFFLSPYIVRSIGVDAYGFVGLANNFISYATLITVALTSVEGRFVTVKIYEKDMNGANKYFSSIFMASSILSAVIGIVLAAIWIYLEHLINIPQNIFWDVKILFAVLFVNCLLSTIGAIFTVATFATNKLYLDSIRKIESNAVRVAIILLLFFLFSPKVSYIGISSLAAGIYVFVFNIYYTRKLLPDIHIRRKHFDIGAIREVLSSGVWNLLTRLGQLLLDGLDLLITNIFIDTVSMGVLSLAKTVPNAISGIVGSMVSVFSPDFTILYAEKKTDELIASVKQSMKIMGIIANLPIIVLIVCGDYFFELWQPTQDASQLQILSILTCFGLIFSGGINCIFNIFTVVNKLRVNSIAVCVSGIISTALVFILLKTTDLGLYAVAGVSSAIAILKNIFVIVPYAAHCLKQKWYVFYPDVFRPVLFVFACSAIGFLIKYVFPFTGWIRLFLLAGTMVLISVVIGGFIVLNKQDRNFVMSKIRRGGKS